MQAELDALESPAPPTRAPASSSSGSSVASASARKASPPARKVARPIFDDNASSYSQHSTSSSIVSASGEKKFGYKADEKGRPRGRYSPVLTPSDSEDEQEMAGRLRDNAEKQAIIDDPDKACNCNQYSKKKHGDPTRKDCLPTKCDCYKMEKPCGVSCHCEGQSRYCHNPYTPGVVDRLEAIRTANESANLKQRLRGMSPVEKKALYDEMIRANPRLYE